MKQPKLSDLVIDVGGSKNIRKKMAKSRKIKITIYFDSDLLESTRKMAQDRGMPYQTLINRLLKQSLSTENAQQSRLDQLEKEVARIKKRLAA